MPGKEDFLGTQREGKADLVQPQVRRVDNDAPNMALLLQLRGGRPDEIALLTAPLPPLGQVLTATERLQPRTFLPRSEDIVTRTTLQEEQRELFAQALLANGFIGEEITYADELHVHYSAAGREMPTDLASKIVLESFVRTRKELRKGDPTMWKAYQQAGDELNLSHLREEEEFLREVYRPTQQEMTQAFTFLHDNEYTQQLLGYARGSLSNVSGGISAEDAVQEALMKAWNTMQKPDGGYPFDKPELGRGFVYRILVNYCRVRAKSGVNRYEKTTDNTESDEWLSINHETSEDEVLMREEDTQMHRGLAEVERYRVGLTADQQRVLELRFGQRLSYAEIAQTMGKSEVAVKALRLKAIQRLQVLTERSQQEQSNPEPVYLRGRLQTVTDLLTDVSIRDRVMFLTKDQQQALALSVGQGLSYAEIAQSMGKSRNAVKSLLRRAAIALQHKTTKPKRERQINEPEQSTWRNDLQSVTDTVAGASDRDIAIALLFLTQAQRTAIILNNKNGLSNSAIAAEMEISEIQVQNLLRKTRGDLRILLDLGIATEKMQNVYKYDISEEDFQNFAEAVKASVTEKEADLILGAARGIKLGVLGKRLGISEEEILDVLDEARRKAFDKMTEE